jgi:choline dehydrogenase-like flavoprotein
VKVEQTDVVVIGSGAAGGMAAYELTKSGVRVVMLEAGRSYSPQIETPMYQTNEHAPLRGASTPDKVWGYFDATIDADPAAEPYRVADGSRVSWYRPRMLGGRTNHWGRVSLRFGEYDFRMASLDGLGTDWPLSYEDISPYYDRVERLIGVYGAAEGILNSPDSPHGVLLQPPPPRACEELFRIACENELGIPVVPAHLAILTRPLGDRQQCLYATPCGRGCSVGANFQSPSVLLRPAMATGRLKILTDSMAFHIELGPTGTADSVLFVDRLTGAVHRIRTRAVVVAASTCESARILLNSKSALFPNGLGNSSGQVGRNLTDTPNVVVKGQLPLLENARPYNDEGTSLDHTYVPWWLARKQFDGHLDFARGYNIATGYGSRRAIEIADAIQLGNVGRRFGRGLMQDMRRYYGSFVELDSYGEMIPNDKSYCEIDPDLKDRWGIPALKFHWHWSEQEIRQMQHSKNVMAEMVQAAGGRVVTARAAPADSSAPITEGDLFPGCAVSHEVGTARMGADATASVLNQFGQTWDVRNVYVLDGAAFASNPCKNPTLTILALACRGSEHLALGLKNREI